MTKQILKTLTARYKLILWLVLAIILVLAPLVVTSPYYLDILIKTGINIALAMTFILVLRTGLINMSIAAFWGAGAYASTMLVMRANLSFWLSLPASALIVGVIALCLGFLLVRTAGFGFVILTAVIGMLTPVIIGSIGAVGGFQGIVGIPPPNPIHIPFLAPVEFVSNRSFYYLMLFLLLLVILLFSGLYKAWSGRAWMAIGLNPNLAQSLGINIFKYRLAVFVVGSAVAGLMGSFYAHYVQSITPQTFDVFKTIYVHVYAILGGLDFAILGPVLGSFVMTFAPELLRHTRQFEPLITGLILILIILFLPGGILSLSRIRPASKHLSQSLTSIGKVIKSSLSSKRATRKG